MATGSARAKARAMHLLALAGDRMHDWLEAEFGPQAAAQDRDPACVPKTRDITVHPGPFTADEVRRVSSRVPGLYVTVLGGGRITPVDETRRDAHMRFGASIVARDAFAAAAIGEALLVRLPFEQWGMPGVAGAAEAEIHNRFSEPLAAIGLTLWEASWTHLVRLGDPAIVDDPLPAHLVPYYAYEPDHGIERRYAPAETC